MIPLHASTSTKRFLTTLSLALIVLGAGTALVAHAETVPSTKCVTPTTIKTRDAAVAQMEKDIALYKLNDWAANAITNYKSELTIAWDAMEYPYCGYGSSAAAPLKSYNKTISRARTQFLTDVKTKKSVPLTFSKMEEPVPLPPAMPSPAVKPAPAVKAEVKVETPKVEGKKVAKKPITKGLQRGQRSEGVKLLQQRLVDHFKLTPATDYVTGYFGPTTYKLLVKYQLEKGIIKSEKDAGSGLVGPKTVAKLNAE